MLNIHINMCNSLRIKVFLINSKLNAFNLYCKTFYLFSGNIIAHINSLFVNVSCDKDFKFKRGRRIIILYEFHKNILLTKLTPHPRIQWAR